MKTNLAVERYTKALFQIAENKNLSDSALVELEALSAFFSKNSRAFALFDSPVINKSEKRALASKIFESNPESLVKKFLLVLIEKNRTELWPSISKHFSNLLNERKGLVEATIVAARSLSENIREKIRKALEARTRKTVIYKTRVEPDLIGGIQLRLGHLLIDGTLRTKLNELKRELCTMHS
ncbi:MAG: ATP synthase F1 subunit delta [Omnitrophica bacterium RIFCSPLOWO2_12_FULL_44_17]|uniref:ATP synthase subunit delta n=1 Tax=Candidatus Danuiimicrobium aquiferis TaxID=1801832 RepID=A0A1G1KX93_9BACT|nr:MAG: ATP synthase F1 subunit delta [Omnitrophica bacterium RIFCSPHIGHO2_02_FULL_45_28]OGW89626.1 MAG: ATP synthase F1 subunit delta [Omnitrophica bacterium RIFCSPHIGHO2_12_FULL_44_12]OGW97432.1 MAG: ATP synthase F1 subunit delta [Omnitrophica bacterium RIFCSPLOWO2_12_FULL_44_17]OGX04506.1 MAG: ATP synthase F1 subunit delta [Omnitrophica bacterium RIFCSPLOWO2_02_FULL_44_11]